jgi:hypothetical protein
VGIRNSGYYGVMGLKLRSELSSRVLKLKCQSFIAWAKYVNAYMGYDSTVMVLNISQLGWVVEMTRNPSSTSHWDY